MDKTSKKQGCVLAQPTPKIQAMTEETTVTPSDPQGRSLPTEAAVLQRLIAELSLLSEDARQRLISTVCTFFGLSDPMITVAAHRGSSPQHSGERTSPFQFSEAEAPAVKQFIHDKAPVTDVERVACLAYYLAHYRSTLHVKTKDVTALNTESAHRPFSNAAVAVDNATKMGYLVPSIKGSKQISAAGERFVEALPDREAAREIMERARTGRGNRTARKAAAL